MKRKNRILKRIRQGIYILFVPALIILAGCSEMSKNDNFVDYEEDMLALEEAVTVYNKAEFSRTGSAGLVEQTYDELPAEGSQIVSKIPQQIIRTADVKFQVKDFKKSSESIHAMVEKAGAYISSEKENTYEYSLNNDMVIRVESEKFEALLKELLQESIYTDYKNVTADDVTEEFIDLQARLKTKREVEARYKEILKQARTIDEILEVEEQIAGVRVEIEVAEGRLKYLKDRVSYSTISLSFYETMERSISPDDSFGSKAGEALETGWEGVKIFALGMIYLWPLWILAAVATIVVISLVRRRRRRKAAKKQ